MASLFSQRALHNGILRLPPELRAAALQRRTFASTSSRKLTLVDVAIAGPNAILDGIHAIGVPWYATLPLAAVLIRGTFVYYFASKPERQRAQIQASLLPLTNAKADIIYNIEHMKEMTKQQERDIPMVVRRIEYTVSRMRAKHVAMTQTGKLFGAPRWSLRPLINFGILIAFTEAIRLKCGTREGLLSLVLTPLQWLAQKIDPKTFPAPVKPEMKDPAHILAERLEAGQTSPEVAAAVQAQSVASTSRASDILNAEGYDAVFQSGASTKLSAVNSPDSLSAYFDPSLATDGIAWFTNLTLPDSTLTFPTIMGLTMLATMTLRPTVGKRVPSTKKLDDDKAEETEIETDSKTDTSSSSSTFLSRERTPIVTLQSYFNNMAWTQRFGIFVSGVFFVVALKLPVAILLYFIPSVAFGCLQARWLDYKYPLPQQIQKCSRPMRLKVRRQWRSAV